MLRQETADFLSRAVQEKWAFHPALFDRSRARPPQTHLPNLCHVKPRSLTDADYIFKNKNEVLRARSCLFEEGNSSSLLKGFALFPGGLVCIVEVLLRRLATFDFCHLPNSHDMNKLTVGCLQNLWSGQLDQSQVMFGMWSQEATISRGCRDLCWRRPWAQGCQIS